jgi:hypothetical protein
VPHMHVEEHKLFLAGNKRLEGESRCNYQTNGTWLQGEGKLGLTFTFSSFSMLLLIFIWQPRELLKKSPYFFLL